MSKKTPKKSGPKKKGHKTPTQTGRARAGKEQAREVAHIPKGEKRSAIAERVAERKAQAEVAKLDKVAATDTETKRVLREVLKPLAKEINHRIKQAGQLDDKADDHRLAAALQLKSAHRRCKEVKINFEKWCEENVEKSYDEVRRLITVAKAPEPAKALADMRAGTAERNSAMRKRQRVSRDVTAPASRSETAWEAADALVSSLPDKEQVSLMQTRAKDVGMALVSETDCNRLQAIDQSEDHPEAVTLEEVYKMFLSLKAKDKLALIERAAEHVGGEFKHDFNEGDPGVPAKMRKDGNGRRAASV